MSARETLRDIKIKSGWSQEELAHRLGVSYVTLNSWLNGKSKPRPKSKEKVEVLYKAVLGRKIKTELKDTSISLRVFFTTPYAGKKHYQTFINAIVEEIKLNNQIITPEDTEEYIESLTELQKQGLNKEQAHYAFIRQGIAAADVVVIEATEEDIRVGHELTLALLFHKPTLVLAQGKDFSSYIAHDLLIGASYSTTQEVQEIVRDFLENSTSGRPEASMQTLDSARDSLHVMTLAKLRRLAKQEPGQFGEWARSAETNPDKVAKDIEATLGRLKKQPSWSVFAPVYNEDSPDYIQSGVARFLDSVLSGNGIFKDSLVIEAACGTGALSRQLAAKGYSNLMAFDNSRPMLAEAFRLCNNYPAIRLFEADVNSLILDRPADAIVWTDYSTNFALDKKQLLHMTAQLTKNLMEGGLLIFDLRTYQGWQVDFYSQPITTFATERFQRIWLNHQDHDNRIIDFDIFIHTRDLDGAWSPWQRESIRERMWYLEEVVKIIANIPHTELKAIYGDAFQQPNDSSGEPSLAYLVLKKTSSKSV